MLVKITVLPILVIIFNVLSHLCAYVFHGAGWLFLFLFVYLDCTLNIRTKKWNDFHKLHLCVENVKFWWKNIFWHEFIVIITFHMGKFSLKKLNEVEAKEQYCVDISNRFAALDNLGTEVDLNKAWELIKQNIRKHFSQKQSRLI